MANTSTRSRGRGKPKGEEAQGQPESNGTTTALQHELGELRQRAETERGAEYDGRMTPQVLRKLEPLLYEPIPARFIERLESTPGKPYESTGIRSAQVQSDRMNAVLGQVHWRVLTRYQDGGTICKVMVVVGNDLHKAMLDERGDLVDGGADILVAREGYGGHKRGSSPGDVWKGAETNALKRVLARFGPGHEVYSLDFEDHPDQGEEYVVPGPAPAVAQGAEQQGAAQPAQVQGDPQRGQPMSEEQAQTELDKLLAEEHELQGLRVQAHDAMVALPQTPPPSLRFQLLAARKNDQHQLQQLVDRVQVQVQPA